MDPLTGSTRNAAGLPPILPIGPDGSVNRLACTACILSLSGKFVIDRRDCRGCLDVVGLVGGKHRCANREDYDADDIRLDAASGDHGLAHVGGHDGRDDVAIRCPDDHDPQTHIRRARRANTGSERVFRRLLLGRMVAL